MCDTGRLDILSDQTDDIDDGTLDRLFLKTLRVFYVTKPSTKPPPQISFVTSKLFLPVRTGERSFESMSQTMYRIEAWLKVTGLYINFANVISVWSHPHNISSSQIQRCRHI